MKKKMTIEEKLEKLRKWQSCQYVHPLTCNHDNIILTPTTNEDGVVILKCSQCELETEHIPEFIYHENLDILVALMSRCQEKNEFFPKPPKK